jgi:hypothetical protein
LQDLQGSRQENPPTCEEHRRGDEVICDSTDPDDQAGCGAMFDENGVGVAQTAAFGGLWLSSGPRTAADQPNKRLVRATGSIF